MNRNTNTNRKTRLSVFFVALQLSALLFVSSAFAQDQSASIAGNVSDAAGAAVKGARVTLRNALTKAERAATTDETGAFTFADLPPGEYQVSLTVTGFAAANRTAKLEAGARATLELKLAPLGVSEAVTVTAEVGYTSTDSAVLGLPLQINEAPVVINTINEKLIEDTAARRLRDLLVYIPGVSGTETSGSTGDQAIIRGFANNSRVNFNGVRRLRNFTNQSQGFGNIERVEILKGPAGVQFGIDEPGGAINFITKQPRETSAYSFGLEGGSFGYVGGEFDATGPVFGRDDLFYRFIVFAERADSFRDTLNSGRVQVAPSILYRYGGGSALRVESEYSFSDRSYDRGTFYLEGAGLKNNFAPISRSLHEPGDFLHSHYTRNSLYWTQRLNNTFALQTVGEVATEDYFSSGARNPNPNSLYKPGTNEYSGNPIVQRTLFDFPASTRGALLRPQIVGNFRAGRVKHANSFGAQLLRGWTSNEGRDGFDIWPLDAFNPVYGTRPIPLPPANPNDPTSIPAGARDFISKSRSDEYGVFYQHKLDIAERLHALGGVRWDYASFLDATVNNRRAAAADWLFRPRAVVEAGRDLRRGRASLGLRRLQQFFRAAVGLRPQLRPLRSARSRQLRNRRETAARGRALSHDRLVLPDHADQSDRTGPE